MPRKDPTELYDEDFNDPSVHGNSAGLGDAEHDIIIENNPNGTTKKIKLDLEIDTTPKNIGENPYSKWIHLARAVDAWRPFPRLFMITYMILVISSSLWYIGLENPTMEQSGFLSVIIGAGAAWFGIYVGTLGKGPRE